VSGTVFEVSGLGVAYRRHRQPDAVVVRDFAVRLSPGRIHGLAGESGCGKSTAALASIGFPAPASVRLGGTAMFRDRDLFTLTRSQLRRLWGNDIAYVGQDASQVLDPLRRIEHALSEPLRLHTDLGREAVRARSLELLTDVGIPFPEAAMRRYPHQFSGGQQQRIAIAVAMACRPSVLVLDEPTTGLDVTTQAQIVDLVRHLVDETGAAAIMISHDLALLGHVADSISIMYAGEIVEEGPADAVHTDPRHPYSAALLDAAPDVDQSDLVVGIPGVPPPSVVDGQCAFAPRCRFREAVCTTAHPKLDPVGDQRLVRCLRTSALGAIASDRRPAERHDEELLVADPLLEVSDLVCSYGPHAIVVHGVSVSVARGETLGIVGESGSGKSTMLRTIAGLHVADSGRIRFAGQELAGHARDRSRDVRRAMQIVFQNPDSSLNPRHSVRRLIERPLKLFRPDLDRRARSREASSLLASVRLEDSVLGRYPSELSGGQQQRVALARAFAAEPDLILCDEVVSALDVSVQAVVLDLLAELSRARGTALVFVTHDLAVVRSIADRICVMRDGLVRETGPTDQIFSLPSDDYTVELLTAVPRPARRSARPGSAPVWSESSTTTTPLTNT
jgi:peptide/nickel transport system ATP-binding protein